MECVAIIIIIISNLAPTEIILCTIIYIIEGKFLFIFLIKKDLHQNLLPKCEQIFFNYTYFGFSRALFIPKKFFSGIVSSVSVIFSLNHKEILTNKYDTFLALLIFQINISHFR